MDAELVGKLAAFAEQLEGYRMDLAALEFDENPNMPIVLETLGQLLLYSGSAGSRARGFRGSR
ncbi:hypothetical protein [Mesorhizobium jarvisii]